MTRFHREYVSCPHCLNEEEIAIWDQIDAVTDPDLKERMLRKKLQVFECKNCGRTHLIAQPLLYRDDMSHLLIWCDPQLDAAEAGSKLPALLNQLPVDDDYRYRLTISSNELNEKIHLAEYELDDRIMEIVKLAVLAWQHEEIRVEQLYFLSAEEDRLLFMAQGEDGKWYQLPVAGELYKRIAMIIAPTLPAEKGWQIVNSEFAKPYFARLEE